MHRNFRLDLLRSTAIILVFLAHTVLSFGAPDSLAGLQLGGIGVDLFFVLSGWLLGHQLLKEQKTTGQINIKRFWLRRWMRTLPAYYAVLSFTLLQAYFSKDNFEIPYSYFFFLQNYHELPFFYVSWSLCVEEQFYLIIAPLLAGLALLPKNYRLPILLVILLAPTLFRTLGLFGKLVETHVSWDCCIFGILLAHLYTEKNRAWAILEKNASLIALATLTILTAFFINRWIPNSGISDPSRLLLAFIFGSWIVWALQPENNASTKAISISNYIATRSYAIYLLHPDALAITHRLLPKSSFIFYIGFAIVLTLIASEILYRLIELPGMKLREKFSISSSTRPVLS